MKTLTATWSPTTFLEDALAGIMAQEIATEIDNEVLVSMLGNWPENTSTGDLPHGWAGELS